MSLSRNLLLVCLATALSVFGWENVNAQTAISLDNAGSSTASLDSFIERGLTFTVTGCEYVASESSASAAATSCESAGLAKTVVLEESSSSRGTAAVEFLNTAGGSILSLASEALNAPPPSTLYSSLNVTLTVSGPPKSLSSFSNAVTGSSGGVSLNSCELTGAASCLSYTGGASGSLYASPAGGTVSNSFTPTGSLSINLMLGVGVPSGVGTLVLNTATLSFSPAPEPASAGLLATGLAGIVVARRRTRRLSASRIPA